MRSAGALWLGLLSAMLLTLVALYGVMLELWTAEFFAASWFGELANYQFAQPLDRLWFSGGLSQLDTLLGFWVAAAAPGIVLYPFCWYAVIWRWRDYSVPRTWYLIGTSYALSCVISVILIFMAMFEYATGPGNGVPFVPSGVSGASLPVVVLESVGALASYAVMLVCLIGMPFFPVAALLAFLHRALLSTFVHRRRVFDCVCANAGRSPTTSTRNPETYLE